jgi:hypothetical protein
MANTRGLARVGMLAVGLGVGAVVAHSPVASADSSTDWLSSIDTLLGGILPGQAASPLEFQISISGFDLLPKTDNLATATSGNGDIAIAYGDGANATATGGVGNYALADGNYALASAGSLTGTNDNLDSAIDIGNNPDPSTLVGDPDGAYAGAGSLIGGTDSSDGISSDDTAIDIGNNGVGSEGPGDGGNSGAFAGDGALVGGHGASSGDTAIDIGNNLGIGDGPTAVDGNDNYASDLGNTNGVDEGAFAAFGENNTAIADNSYTIDGNGVLAGDGNGNYAFVDGPTDTSGSAVGTSDIAYVLDPFGKEVSSAISGYDGTTSGNYDLAAVLLTDGQALATNGNFVYDIVTALGNDGPATAASGGGLLAELLSLF